MYKNTLFLTLICQLCFAVTNNLQAEVSQVENFTKEQLISSDSTCRKIPQFVHDLGFNTQRSAFSSSVPRQAGLFYLEFAAAGGAESRSYQHPSWKQAGYLGAFTLSKQGDLFLIPSPHVNLLDNPPEKSNFLYRISSTEQEMSKFISLPPPRADINSSAFGTLGLAYSCSTDSIYVSSVFGSGRKSELGMIFQIDSKSSVIKSVHTNFDAFGLASILVDSKPVLLAGSARNSKLYALALDEAGKFTGERKEVLDIEGLGPRGDDRIKKIVFDQTRRTLILTGYAFHFNFVNPIVPQQSEYHYSLSDKWKFTLLSLG